MERDGGTFRADTPVTARERFLNHVYNIVYENASKGGPLAGTNVWAWGGEARAKHDDGFWQKGDPFTGDPPQEHQGLNSIFDTDTTTHEVIKNHSIKMNKLNSEN
jgi:mannan endo-1,4-beta-mannosidase